MTGLAQIAIPLPHLCTVSLWLLKGEPLTLSDAGPSNRELLVSLEEQLAERGLGVDDLELLLNTHHHLDHSGRGSARISPTATRFAPAGERCAPSSAAATALRTRCSSTTRRATPSS